MIATAAKAWQRWGGKIVPSVADQGAFSGANFVLNILLARWLTPDEYGSFAVAFSIFLFVAGFYNALVLEPMSVFGPKRHKDDLPLYLAKLVWVHVALTFALGLILAGTAAVLAATSPGVTAALLGLSISTPFILVFWFFRRVCYLQPRPEVALKSSLLYGSILIIGAVIFRSAGAISPLTSFILMGGAGFTASLTFRRQLGIAPDHLMRGFGASGVADLVKEHWVYSKWVVGTAFVYWLGTQIYMPFVAMSVGLTQAGALRAIQNLIMPLQQISTALGTLFLPWVARHAAVQGGAYARTAWAKMTVLNVTFGAAYVLALVVAGPWVVALLYGQEYYQNFVWLIPYLGLAAVVASALAATGVVLGALERPDGVFWAYLGSAGFTATVGLYLVAKMGIHGAAIGTVVGTSVAASIAVFLLRRRWRRVA